jgi:hypothetical protein
MSGDRYVLLGLARPRAEWFRRVGQWSTTAVLPCDFSKCVSAEELRARLASGRRWSALLVDGGLPAVDRDLLDAAGAAGCPVLVVDGGGRDWRSLGAAAVLPPDLERGELLEALATHAELVGEARPVVLDDEPVVPFDLGRVVAVCGPGGTGASTVAAALAQGIGERGPSVLVADLARNAEQAMLHDVRDVAPGLQELVELHRSRQPSPEEVRSLTFHVVARHYHLLLGLRQARQWPTLRPRAFTTAFASMRRTFDVTVCDVTADLEGEDVGGSIDVEERNLAARTAVTAADVVLAVGRPGVKGLHSLVRVLGDLTAVGVPQTRVVPVVNAAPRNPRHRAELAHALRDLLEGAGDPVFLPAKDVEDELRDVVPLPGAIVGPVTKAYERVLDRVGPLGPPAPAEPVLVAPGSLGGSFE